MSKEQLHGGLLSFHQISQAYPGAPMREHAVESRWRSLYNRMLTHGGSEGLAHSRNFFTRSETYYCERMMRVSAPSVRAGLLPYVSDDMVIALVWVCVRPFVRFMLCEAREQRDHV